MNFAQGPTTDHERRREMHCGWMDEEQWLYPIRLPSKMIGERFEGGRPVPGPDAVEWVHDVCPGWAVRQPLVEEIAQASVAFEKGSLDAMFPGVAGCVVEGVFAMWQARQVYEQQQMAALAKEEK